MAPIIRRSATTAPTDNAALALFERQWSLYRKIVDNDYLHHRGSARALQQAIGALNRPRLRVLELACGDCSVTVRALGPLDISHYHGVDLSTPALELAAANLQALDWQVTLEQRDFSAALREYREPVDVIMISLSLHHLDTGGKRAFIRDARRALGPDGLLLIYEPTCANGETRDQYMQRFEGSLRADWTAMNAEEQRDALDHVLNNDLPEPVSTWHHLGEQAGFSRCEERYVSGDGFYRVFLYTA